MGEIAKEILPVNIEEELKQSYWSSMTPSEFSFAIFQMLRFDSHAMQLILESRSAHERLLMINAALESAYVE